MKKRAYLWMLKGIQMAAGLAVVVGIILFASETEDFHILIGNVLKGASLMAAGIYIARWMDIKIEREERKRWKWKK